MNETGAPTAGRVTRHSASNNTQIICRGCVTSIVHSIILVVSVAARPAIGPFSGTTAAPYFSRLVNEAPSTELKLVALHRAIQVWNASGTNTFPPELTVGMNTVLSQPIPLDQYVELLKMAAMVEPDFLRSSQLPDLGGIYSAPRLCFQSLARFRVEEQYGFQDRAKHIVQVHKMVGLPPWPQW